MELELNWDHINHHELLHSVCICQEETLETIVPDAQPDILRIAEAGGQLCLNDKENQEGSALIRGTINGWLLYQPENGERLCRIEFKLPFNAKADVPGLTPNGHCVARPVLCKIDARTLNPRKVLVRADICVELSLYEPRDLSVCCGLECDSKTGVQQLKGEQQTYLTTAIREKEFSVYEEIHAPVGMDGGGELLCLSADAWCTEAKMIGKRLLFKGEAGLRMRYFAGGKICSTSIPISFSQVIELEGAGEQGDCSVVVYVTNVGCVRAGEDGRQMNITLDLVGQGIVAEKRSLVMLQDAYSTCGQLVVDSQSQFVSDLLEQYTKPQSMRELIETEVQAKSVVDAAVRVCQVTASGSTVQAQLQVDVLYVDDHDTLYSTSRTILVSGQQEIPEGCNCQSSCFCPGEAFAAVTSGGVEVRFNLEFSGCITRKVPVVTVKNARWSESDCEGEQPRPSVVMRAAMNGERLWDIAKAYKTTPQSICQANGFEPEDLTAGMMLLIPAGK